MRLTAMSDYALRLLMHVAGIQIAFAPWERSQRPVASRKHT
jgi:hypothetical protein